MPLPIFLHSAKTIEHEPTNGLRLPGKVEPEPRGLSDKDRSRFEGVFQQPWLGRHQNVNAQKKQKGMYMKALSIFLRVIMPSHF